MAVIVHIEVHTVSCKVAGIFHLVERSIHDDFSTHGQTGIVCIYCDGMVCSRIDTGGGRTTRPYSAADGATAIGTCDHLSDVVANLNRPGSNTGLGSDFFGKMVLQVENGFQFRLYLIESEVLILGAQVADEHGGIVTNLRQIVVILLTAGVTGFHSVDLLLKLGFEFRVVGICTGDLDVISRPRGGCYRGEYTSGNHGTGLERCHNQQESHCNSEHRAEAGTAGKRCPNRLKAILQTLRHRPGGLSGVGCILCSVFGLVVFLANFPPLLPTGDGVGCGSIGLVHGLPIPGFKICLIRFPFQLPGFFCLPELMTVSGVFDFPDAAFSRGSSLLKCLCTDILVLICLLSLVPCDCRCCSCREDVVFHYTPSAG